ncbi:MAG: TonB-dependent receptor [Bacteroidetes bacterium]|nr:MAG: TonB-dependent receptor [Bacteroidota bacterium]
MFKILLLLLFCPVLAFSQVTGKVLEGKSKDPIVGAKITASDGNKTLTDYEGKFSIRINNYPVWIKATYLGLIADSALVYSDTTITFYMFEALQEIETVVVSAGRRDQSIEEVPISMEVLKPELINNKGFSNLEQAVNQSPGVFAMDGQVSIRGGGGFAYGAGSRVAVIWNGIPMVSPDVGDAKWNSIPMEQASQIEVLKGASSVLYGSGALNGIISLTEKEPGPEESIVAKVQFGIYDNPKRQSLKWWSKNPAFYMMDAYYGKMNKRFGLTIGVNGFSDKGYKDGEYENRGRVNGTFYFRPIKFPKLKSGIGYNFQYQDIGVFVLWQSDSLGYTPFGGSDTSVPGSSLSFQRSIRLNLDPYVKMFDKWNNKHFIRTRYYLVSTGNLTELYASSKAEMYYADYQFQRETKRKGNLTLGLTNINNVINSSVFGDHLSESAAIYSQFDQKLKKWDFTAGLRFEYFQQDDKPRDSDFKMGELTLPIYPILRAGVHFEPIKHTHLRATVGQGIRFPSVAERFVATSNGGVILFPNPDLKPEIGWSSEIGVKQVVKMGEWKGLIDVAGFINHYDNMIEFAFGVYNPDSIPLNTVPGTPGYIYNWVGLRATNAEKAQISGVELSFNSEGKIKAVDLTTLLGYTYMNPISLNKDPQYLTTFSDSGSNLLKYRFRHLAKMDVQAKYKRYMLGFSSRYNSNMDNIDVIFEDGILGQQILQGLKEYRMIHNKGALVFDIRAGYQLKEQLKINLIANNLLNAEYSSRPADLQPPRNFILQLQYQL